MFLKKMLLITTVIVSISGYFLQAQDQKEVFLSLSRQPEYLESLPNNILTIGTKEISESGATNLAELLQKETLIYTSKTGTVGALSSISLRGMSSADVLVLIDGQPLNSISVGMADLSSLPLNSVERVEIIRGPASAIYGFGASGGIINLITKKLATQKLNVDFNYGSFNTIDTNINVNKQLGNNYFNFSAGKTKSSGQRQNSDYENTRVAAKFGVESPEYSLNLSGQYFSSLTGSPGPLSLNNLPLTVEEYDGNIENSAASPRARQKDERNIWQSQYKKYFKSGDLTFNLFYRYNEQNYRDPDWFTDNTYFEYVYKPQVIYNWRNLINIGIETQPEKYINKDNQAFLTKMDNWRSNTAVFYEQKIATEKLTFRPSLRYDNNSAFGEAFSPQLSVIWKTPENFSLIQKLSFNCGQSWRAPTFTQLYWPEETFTWFGTNYTTRGNSELKPEKSIGGDIGISRQGSISYNLNYYFNQTENKIQNYTEYPDPTTILTYPKNIARTTSQGIECSITHKINQYSRQHLDYTYTWALDETTKKLLVYQPLNRLGYTISAEIQKLDVELSGNFIDQQLTEYDTWLPGYFLLDTRIGLTLSDNLRLCFTVNNILDKKYQNRAGYPLPGQTLSASINWKFL